MTVKVLFLISIQAILFEAAYSQCIGPPGPYGPGFPNTFNDGFLGPGPILGRVVGANLIVDTSPPDAVSIYSDDLIIDGTVFVEGKLPFSGTVALEGVVPACGTSAVSYECGSGNIGMTETPVPSLAVLPPGGRGWIGMPRVPSLANGIGPL